MAAVRRRMVELARTPDESELSSARRVNIYLLRATCLDIGVAERPRVVSGHFVVHGGEDVANRAGDARDV